MSETLETLARRCEREQPSPALDRAIFAAVGGMVGEIVPAFTTSLDAAVTLVPEDCWWEGAFSDHSTTAEIHHHEHYDEIGRGAGAHTAAMALCAAALRARAAGFGSAP